MEFIGALLIMAIISIDQLCERRSSNVSRCGGDLISAVDVCNGPVAGVFHLHVDPDQGLIVG